MTLIEWHKFTRKKHLYNTFIKHDKLYYTTQITNTKKKNPKARNQPNLPKHTHTSKHTHTHTHTHVSVNNPQSASVRTQILISGGAIYINSRPALATRVTFANFTCWGRRRQPAPAAEAFFYRFGAIVERYRLKYCLCLCPVYCTALRIY